jgi:hypothetical protein
MYSRESRIMFGVVAVLGIVALVVQFVEWRYTGVIHWLFIANMVCFIMWSIVLAVVGFPPERRRLRMAVTLLPLVGILLVVWSMISAPPGHLIR